MNYDGLPPPAMRASSAATATVPCITGGRGRDENQRPVVAVLSNLLATIQKLGRLGTWEYDAVTRTFSWSEGACQVMGWGHGGLDQRFAAYLETVHDADRGPVAAAFGRLGSEEAGDVLEVRHRLPRPGGDPLHVLLRALPVPAGDIDRHGRHWVGVVMDETEELSRTHELSRINRALLTLSACNRTLMWAKDESELLERMCRLLVDIGRHCAAAIALVEEDGSLSMRAAASRPGEAAALRELHLWPERTLEPARRAVSERMAVIAASPPRDGTRARAVAALPLRGRRGDGRPLGVLLIHAEPADAFDAREMELLLELADDASFGLVTMRDRVTQVRNVQRLERSMEQTVSALAATIEKRDPYTAGHQKRVADLSRRLAERLGLPSEEVRGIVLAATIHDIGKIYVPSEILTRPGRLSANEFRLIHDHCQIGYDIVKDIDLPWPVADMVLQHHERLDGSGYPGGLAGESITLGARIIGVADTVEAMASHRPYRPGLGLARAMAEIRENSGTHYDPRVVEVCLALFEDGAFILDAPP